MARKKTEKDYNQLLAETIADGMLELKAEEIVIMDMRQVQNAMADYFVICHGNSNTQVQAIARSIEKVTAQKLNDNPWHIEGTTNATWILMDYVNVVAHVFEKGTRQYYALEELWADADTMRIAS
jgi:ribosome-associated protein